MTLDEQLGKPWATDRAFYEDMIRDGELMETRVQNNRVWERWQNKRLNMEAWFSNWDMPSNAKH